MPKWLLGRDAGSLAKRGSSGGHDALPPSAGQLAPAARFALTAPHLPDSRPHPLVVPVTIAEPDAPEFVRTPTEIGFPWMDRKNNSEGTGEHGIGNGKDHGMGNGLGDGIGVGNENAVQTVRSWQFLPAKDAGQHPVALWIKVETMFRLF